MFLVAVVFGLSIFSIIFLIVWIVVTTRYQIKLGKSKKFIFGLMIPLLTWIISWFFLFNILLFLVAGLVIYAYYITVFLFTKAIIMDRVKEAKKIDIDDL